MIQWAPRDSALAKARFPDTWMWGFDQHLWALMVDILALGNWQRGGNAKAPKPPRIPRPGVDPNDQGDGVRRRKSKKTSTRAEVDKRLNLKIKR